MQDIIKRILEGNYKKAIFEIGCSLLLTLVSALVWPGYFEKMSSYIPILPDQLDPKWIIWLGSFITFYFVINIIIWGVQKYIDTKKILKNANIRKDKITRTLPHLSKGQLDVLSELENREKIYDSRKTDIKELKKLDFIQIINSTSQYESLFCLSNEVKAPLHSLLTNERKKLISNLKSTLNSDQKKFLNLFFSEFGMEETQGPIPWERYINVVRLLVVQGILDEPDQATPKNRISTLHIPDDVAKECEIIFDEKLMRRKIILNVGPLIGSGAPGSKISY